MLHRTGDCDRLSDMNMPGFKIVAGSIEHIEEHALSINGVRIDIPEEGCAYIGVELGLENGLLDPRIRELTGPGARRFSLLQIGRDELRVIIAALEEYDGPAMPFAYFSQHPFSQMSMS